MNKSEIIKSLIFSAISTGELYILYGTKYLNINSIAILAISYVAGKQIQISMQKDNAGGTTPYNPLKIPAKHFTTPAQKTGGTTPYNPLKIPAQKITPIH